MSWSSSEIQNQVRLEMGYAPNIEGSNLDITLLLKIIFRAAVVDDISCIHIWIVSSPNLEGAKNLR